MVEKVTDNEIAVVSEKKIAYRQASAEFRSRPSILKSIRAKVAAFLADKKPHQRVDVGVAMRPSRLEYCSPGLLKDKRNSLGCSCHGAYHITEARECVTEQT